MMSSSDYIKSEVKNKRPNQQSKAKWNFTEVLTIKESSWFQSSLQLSPFDYSDKNYSPDLIQLQERPQEEGSQVFLLTSFGKRNSRLRHFPPESRILISSAWALENPMDSERNVWKKFSERQKHTDAAKTCSGAAGKSALWANKDTIKKNQQVSYKWLNCSYPDSSRSSHSNKHMH